jgi:hypothetical protein
LILFVRSTPGGGGGRRTNARFRPGNNSRVAKIGEAHESGATYFPVDTFKQPLAIRFLTWFAVLASAGMYLSILLAVLDIGPHIMGGEQVTRAEWLHIAAPLVAVIGILMAFIAYGFASQKPWSRHLVLAIFSLIIVSASILGGLNLIHHAIMWRAIVNASVFGGASVWYFYFKSNVVAHFRELANR